MDLDTIKMDLDTIKMDKFLDQTLKFNSNGNLKLLEEFKKQRSYSSNS